MGEQEGPTLFERAVFFLLFLHAGVRIDHGLDLLCYLRLLRREGRGNEGFSFIKTDKISLVVKAGTVDNILDHHDP